MNEERTKRIADALVKAHGVAANCNHNIVPLSPFILCPKCLAPLIERAIEAAASRQRCNAPEACPPCDNRTAQSWEAALSVLEGQTP